MKRKLIILAASLLTLSGTVLAAKPVIAIKGNNFAPVAWRATFENGGFQFTNQTSKNLLIQVTVDQGFIYTYRLTSKSVINGCQDRIKANSYVTSMVCELEPNESLMANLDYATQVYASGTYQVELAR